MDMKILKTIKGTSPLILGLFALFNICTFQAKASSDSLKQVWLDKTLADSTRFKALNEYAGKYAFSEPDSVITVTIYHFDLANQRNTKSEMAKALDNKALALCMLGDYDTALSEMKKVMDLMTSLNDSIGLAKTSGNMGSIYYYQSKFKEAVRFFNNTLAILENKNEEKSQANVLNNLGLIYYEINNFDLAIDYYNKALELYRKIGLENEIGNIWLNIGVVYFKKNQFDEAISFGRKAVGILDSDNNQVSVADCYFLFAQSYQAENKIDSAFFYINKSLAINNTIGHKDKINTDKILLADLTRLNDVQTATKIGEEVLQVVKNGTNLSSKVGVYKLLHKCYKKQGNFIKALNMHEKYIHNYDSLLIEEDNIAVIRETIQSEYEIKLFNTQLENEKAQAQIKLAQLKRTYGILLTSLALILLTIFYARSRIKTQHRQKEDLLKEIERLKQEGSTSIALSSNGFELDQNIIEKSIGRKLNETDWKVLNILLDDPVISNKDIAARVFMSVDGIGSCLRRMYEAFEIKESKYKKISLIMKAIKVSNS